MRTKAVVLEKFHSFDSIKIADVCLEELRSDDIEVQVHYCGVNFADVYQICQLMQQSVPFTLGIECSGIITGIGAKVNKDFQIGDKVVCYDYKGGLHQEKIRVNYKKCYKLADGIDLSLAAAIFVNYITAWFALFPIGNISDNQTIFVDSGAGGVGLTIIQLVRNFRSNVRIISTCSASKRQFLEGNAVQWVAYDALEDISETFDLIIEAQSTKSREILMAKLNPFGKCVIIGAKDLTSTTPANDGPNPFIDPTDLIFGNKVVAGLHIGIIADQHPELMQKAMDAIFAEILKSNSIQPVVKILPFHEAKRAYQLLKDRQNVGKIVLKCNIE